MAYSVGLVGPYQFDGDIQNDFFAAMAIWYMNRAPLVTRLPNVGTSATLVKAVDDQFRPKSVLLSADPGAPNTNTTITVADASPFMVGDLIQIDSEIMQVTADPNTSANTLTVTRGVAATTNAAHNTNSNVYLIGNARTGSEIDQSAPTRPFDLSLTYPQTVQQPYQIGGSTEASSPNMAIPLGFASLVGYERAKAAQETLFDFERSIYYSRAVALGSSTSRPAMRGLRQRITTNNVTSPTNASAYKPSDFVRDVITPGVTNGGKVDVVVCSEEYRTGFATWGLNLTLLDPTATMLGQNFDTFLVSGINAKIIFAPLLRPYTAFGLTSEEVYMAWKREPRDYPRGRRGDAIEGDVIGEGCVVLNNEAHHTWVEGVTAFAKQS